MVASVLKSSANISLDPYKQLIHWRSAPRWRHWRKFQQRTQIWTLLWQGFDAKSSDFAIIQTTCEAEVRMVDQERNERNHSYMDHAFAHKNHYA